MKPTNKDLEVWNNFFGNKSQGYDSFGSLIKKDNWKDKGKYGWNTEHIWPKNPKNPKTPKGSQDIDNLEPMHWKNNQAKGNKMKKIRANNRVFSIKEYTRDKYGKAIGEFIEIIK